MSEPPRQGLGDVSSHLEDVVIATWDVDVDALAAHLPDGIEPERRLLDDGRERALVSAVSFVNRDFFVGFAPFVKLRAQQTNYRAYVRRGDEHAVWFFGTSLASPVVVPRYIWGLPWARSTGAQRADWSDGTLRELRWDADSELGRECLRLRGSGQAMGRIDGFADTAETQRILTHPTVGYLRRRGKSVVSYSVWHPPFACERATADEARFELFETLSLVEQGRAPLSLLVQQRIHYLIFLPPRRVR